MRTARLMVSALVLSVFLAACGDDPEPSQADAAPPLTSAGPVPLASPTDPAAPDARTDTGARARAPHQ